MNKKMINQIHCYESFPDNMVKIAIYCHGYGDNKDRITQHNELLNNNNIGIISFDFPCHGEDKNDNKYFNLDNCINYLNTIIDYAKTYNVPISLIGSSFGGYIILSRINKTDEQFDKVFLKYPAVNFYECTIRKLRIDISYFNDNDYYQLPNGEKLYKDTIISFKNDDLMTNFNKHNNDIYIIHGDKDHTVLLSDVKSFSENNDIKLDIIEGACHGMKDYLDLVNDKLINYLKG